MPNNQQQTNGKSNKRRFRKKDHLGRNSISFSKSMSDLQISESAPCKNKVAPEKLGDAVFEKIDNGIFKVDLSRKMVDETEDPLPFFAPYRSEDTVENTINIIGKEFPAPAVEISVDDTSKKMFEASVDK